jgi:hypothetical protein
VRRWLGVVVFLALVLGGAALLRGDVPCELLSVQPACEVALRPGPSEDVLALVEVTGAPTEEATGELRLTTVAVEEDLDLREWLRWRTSDVVEVTSRDVIFPPGADRREVAEQNAALMADSQLTATIVALEQLGYELDGRGAAVAAVTSDAVTDDLVPGDLIVAVDGDAVAENEEVVAAVRSRRPGDEIVFEVVSEDGDRREVAVALGASPGNVVGDLVRRRLGTVVVLGLLLVLFSANRIAVLSHRLLVVRRTRVPQVFTTVLSTRSCSGRVRAVPGGADRREPASPASCGRSRAVVAAAGADPALPRDGRPLPAVADRRRSPWCSGSPPGWRSARSGTRGCCSSTAGGRRRRPAVRHRRRLLPVPAAVLDLLQTWLFTSLVLTALLTAGAHYLLGGIRPEAEGEKILPSVKAHLAVLLALILAVRAWGYWLDRYQLNYSPRGTVTGASYTDVNAELPALYLLIGVSVIAIVLVLVAIRRAGSCCRVPRSRCWSSPRSSCRAPTRPRSSGCASTRRSSPARRSSSPATSRRPAGVRPRRRRAAAVHDRERPRRGGRDRERGHAAQRPAVGPGGAGDHLPGAAVAAALLRVQRRRDRPLRDRRRDAPGDALHP